MNRRKSIALFLIAPALISGAALFSPNPVAAAPSRDQVAKIRKIDAEIKAAGQLFRTKKYKESAEQIKAAEETLSELASGPRAKDVARNLVPLQNRLKKARTLLEQEGIKLPPPPNLEPAEGDDAAAQEISFTKQIAPMLLTKCGQCHVSDSKGGFNFATFAALEQGSTAGRVYTPGTSRGSTLIDIIESGDMPRGNGPQVTPAELAALAKWIDQGAKFDGQDKTVQLTTLTGQAPMQPGQMEARLEVVRATGNETVSFAKDIAPVLVESCGGCHGNRNPGGNFNMVNFAALLRGGDSGLVLSPGKAKDSLLIKKIRGEAGARMPLRAAPLSDDVITKFEKWIAEGAKFDGPDANRSNSDVIAYVFAQGATHAELGARRAEVADEKWRLAIPDEKPERVETENFLVVGNVGNERLKEVGDIAEEQVAGIRKGLKLPTDGPFIKGRMTLYVFRQRFDYSEFGTMVEKRALPEFWLGHWGYDVVDAYGVVAPVQSDEVSLPALIAQQVAATYFASLGQGSVPQWFADGVGRTVASRLAPRDPRVRQWDDRLPAALAALTQPDGFLASNVPPEDSAILGYSFVKLLMTRPANFSLLMQSISKGEAFDIALARAYNGNIQSLSTIWFRTAASKRR